MGCGTSKALIELPVSSHKRNLDKSNPAPTMSRLTRAESYTSLYDAGTEFMQGKKEAVNMLEEKIRTAASLMSVDAEEALSIVKKHPDLRGQFTDIIELMSLFQSKMYAMYFAKLRSQDNEHDRKAVSDFLALTGGAAATVVIYVDAMEKLGVTYISRELLQSYFNPDDELNEDEDEEDRNSNTTTSNEKKKTFEVICGLRDYWINASDASEHFCTSLIESGLLQFLVEDIKHLNKTEEDKIETAIFDASVTIMHNCARHKQLQQGFHNSSVVQLLTPFLSKKRETKLLTLLTLSYIINENENELLLADDSDFDFLLSMVEEAWEDDDHGTFEGYSLWELLKGLSNLAQNDVNKKLLMRKGVLDHLKPVLKNGETLEKEEALKIVWELSFDKENRQRIQEDSEIMQLLDKLKSSPTSGTAECARGALWVLAMDKKVSKDQHYKSMQNIPLPPPPPQTSFGAPPPPPSISLPSLAQQQASSVHIMISYQWGNQSTLLQIREMLRQREYQVWMDVDNMKGSTLQAMADAIEKAAVVLICMSQRYKESTNCRTEAEYAFALGKPIIPLLMEGGYKPNGWLGILKGTKLFFDFSGKYPLARKFEELVHELGDKGKEPKTPDDVDSQIVAVKHSSVFAGASSKDVTTWSQNDVLNWLKNNHLEKQGKGLQNLSGANLKFLYKLSQRAPEFFFNYLKDDLGLKQLNDLMSFSNALEKLS